MALLTTAQATGSTQRHHFVPAVPPLVISNVVISLVAFADVADPSTIGDFAFTISAQPIGGGSVTTPVASVPTAEDFAPPVPEELFDSVRSATVIYSAPVGPGTDSFDFQACADLNDNGNTTDTGECDTATVTIDFVAFVEPPDPVAPTAEDREVITEEDTPVEINLGEGGEGSDDPCDSEDPPAGCDSHSSPAQRYPIASTGYPIDAGPSTNTLFSSVGGFPNHPDPPILDEGTWSLFECLDDVVESGTLQQCVPVTAGSSYDFSARSFTHLSTGVSTLSVSLSFFSSSDCTTGFLSNVPASSVTPPNWFLHSSTGVAAPGSAMSARIQLFADAGSVDDDMNVSWDNTNISLTSGGPNLLINPEFDLDPATNGWTYVGTGTLSHNNSSGQPALPSARTDHTGTPAACDSPFSFTGAACISVTDVLQKGDRFTINDGGNPIFTTPSVPAVAGSVSDPITAFGDSSYSSGSFVVMGAGSHSITIETDFGAGFSNAHAFARVDSSCLPDLVVSNLTHDPTSPDINDTIEFTAEVRNIGLVSAGASTLSFVIDSDSHPESSLDDVTQWGVDALDPGESQSIVRMEGVTLPEQVTVTAAADIDGDVTESDENNNTSMEDFLVADVTEARVVATITAVSLGFTGTLTDSQGSPITLNTPLPDTMVTYTAAGTGEFFFEYTLTNTATGLTSLAAMVDLTVTAIIDDCVLVGRLPGCDQ